MRGGRWLSKLLEFQLVDFVFFLSCVFGYLPKQAVDDFHSFRCQHVTSGWSALAFGGCGGDGPADEVMGDVEVSEIDRIPGKIEFI